MPLATVYGKINLMDGQEVPISSRNPFGVLLENTNPESLHPSYCKYRALFAPLAFSNTPDFAVRRTAERNMQMMGKEFPTNVGGTEQNVYKAACLGSENPELVSSTLKLKARIFSFSAT